MRSTSVTTVHVFILQTFLEFTTSYTFGYSRNALQFVFGTFTCVILPDLPQFDGDILYGDQDYFPNDQQQDFPPNSKQTIIWSVTEATSHLHIKVSCLHTCAHYIMIYNSSSQEEKPTNFHCYAFSVLPLEVYLGWLPSASCLRFYLRTINSSKKNF